MKTLRNKTGTKYARVRNKKAHEIQSINELLAKGWKFCTRGEWKDKVRDA